jgi:hypothetical protein
VYTNDTSPADQGSPYRLLHAALTGISLLLVGWCPASVAAAHAGPCGDPVARDLQSLDVDTLTIELVDLSDVSKSPETADKLAESVAPLLFLTPRVASILQDVFGDSDKAEAVAAPGTVQPAAKTDERAVPTSPVVDNVNSPEIAEPVSPLYENAAILPRFQQQMYRTDI